jgi:hypothetical protein
MGLRKGRPTFRREDSGELSPSAQLVDRLLDDEIPSTRRDLERAVRGTPEGATMKPRAIRMAVNRGLLDLEEEGAEIAVDGLGYIRASKSAWLVERIRRGLVLTRADLATLEGQSRFVADKDFIKDSVERWAKVQSDLRELERLMTRNLNSCPERRLPRRPAASLAVRLKNATAHRLNVAELEPEHADS